MRVPKWTNEQKDAIYKEGSNIIVSAGAGSGKTAVLSERVLEKLKKGINIKELLILTFTEAAAGEMKERIRKKIASDATLRHNLDYLEVAHIQTFDAYTLSLIKKYHYLLNVSPNISIIDSSIIALVKNNILEEIFLENYATEEENFAKFINNNTIKNDTTLKQEILKILQNLSLKSNKEDYLNNYFKNYLSEEKIDEYLKEYYALLLEIIEDIETNLYSLESSNFPSFYEEMVKVLDRLIHAKTYDEIKASVDIKLPRRPRESEEIAIYKDNISDDLDELNKLLRFKSEEEIRNSFKDIKDYIEVILNIAKEYFNKLDAYKKKYDLYEFTDIAIMAINLLKQNPHICEEIKNSFSEIEIDEYQDTSDLQEEFINLIQNNNVYMVGDIKQAIYGFRNANPQIFKEKYDAYSNQKGGLKIDLLKNFRSRKEVIAGINDIFSLIMDDDIGGANYKLSHQMNYGNTDYDINKSTSNYDLEIYNYNDKENKNFKHEEMEAFIIAKDILKKIEKHYQVIDKETHALRDVSYDDFCIIMDRGSSFPTYKKIFEYFQIPLSIYEDKKLTSEIDIILINNIIGLILKISNQKIDNEFKYYFMSVARSFLFEYSDNEIFNIITNNTYEDTLIYKIAKEISSKLDSLNNYELLNLIIDKFSFYQKIIKIGDVNNILIRLDNLFDMAINLNNMGYTIEEFKEYLGEMINSKNEIKYSFKESLTNCVKIMNIHKSKGLEFPVCYFSGYYKEFNIRDVVDKFLYDNKYGLITPYYNDGVKEAIIKDLYRNKYYIDNISERIRLFYVALTRAREKMIIVCPLDENEEYVKNIVDRKIRKKYKSLQSILNSIYGNIKKYIKNINLEELNLTKEYLYNKSMNLKKEKNINVNINYHELNILKKRKAHEHASKVVDKLLDKKTLDMMEYGTNLHKAFEEVDFLNIPKDTPYKELLDSFVKKLNINNKTEIYKEQEFILKTKEKEYQGIIDLVLIEGSVIKIIDYKTKNIDTPEYEEQLNIYYQYLKSISPESQIKLYLYSIIDNELREVKVKELIEI